MNNEKFKYLTDFNKKIIDAVPDEIVVLETKSRKIIFANSAVYKNYALTEKDVVGKRCHEVLHPGEVTNDICPFNVSMKTGRKKHIVRKFYHGKTKRYFSVTTMPLRNSEGNIVYILHISKDITKRKEAEELAKESKDRYRRLVINAAVGIITFNEDGNIIDVNRNAVLILNLKSIKQAKSKSLFSYENLKNTKLVLDANECFSKGKKIFSEMHYHKLGRKIYIRYYLTPMKDKEGRITCIEAIVENSTKTKIAEQKMKSLNNNLLTLSKTSSMLQISTDIDQIINIAIDTFRAIGFDRVRVYLMRDGELVGAKSSHIKDSVFKSIVLNDSGEFPKVTQSIRKKQPIIIKEVKTKYSKILGKENLEYSASLPLIGMDNIIGMISVDNKLSKKPIQKKDVKLLMTIANQIAAAIENATLYKENKQRIQTLSALYDVSSALSSTLELEKILNIIVIRVVKILKADICSIMLYEKSRKELILKTMYDVKDKYPKKVIDLLCGELGKKVIRNRRPIQIPDLKEHEVYCPEIERENIVSMLSVPLLCEGDIMGVINIFSRKTRKYLQRELDLLRSVSSQAAILIENSKLYEKIKVDKENLSALLELSQEINSTFNKDKLLGLILDKTMDMTGADFGFLLLVNENYLELKLSRGLTKEKLDNLKIKIGEGISGHVVKLEKPIIVTDVSKDERYIHMIDGIKSFAAIPLKTRSKVIGVLSLESKKLDNFRRYKKSLNILTNQVVIATENARLYSEISNFNKRLKNEINLATRELREKNIELKKMDQMKNEFVSNVSHELRTPLTSIAGYTKLMRMGKLGPINKNQESSLSIVSEEAERLTRLINNVLDLSKLESGKIKFRLEMINLKEIAEDTIKTLQNRVDQKHIKLKLTAPYHLPKFKASKDLIKQVFINLLNNALKFTEENGRIDVIIKKSGEYVQVSVKDTGVGVAREEIPNLFDKFYQVDSSMTRAHGGTGLGLVIVKHIIDAHNGHIKVKSEIGKGSEFVFTLPLRK